MRKLFFQDKEISRVLKFKEEIEKNLKIKLKIERNEVTIEAKSSVDEYLAEKILDALSLGFDLNVCLQLKNEEFILKKINIKDLVKESRVNVVAGRIIGTKGKTKKLIEKLSECEMVIHDHLVAIIGHLNNIEIANHAIQSLIRGSPQSKVYSFLEKSRSKLKELSEEDVESMIEKKAKKEEEK
jgi:ribosomal RNA assembly protein